MVNRLFQTLSAARFVLPLVVQSCIYLGLLVLDEYLGTLLAMVIGGISLAVFIVSVMVELIEPSRVPKAYWGFMMSAWVAPTISMISFYLLRH
ncbi:MAG: hypothetical protein AAF741_07805 [Bacteroidota bacterium]